MSAILTPPPNGTALIDIDTPKRRAATTLRLQRVGAILAGAAALIGVAVLLGYWIRSSSVVRLSRQLPPMYPNAAIGLLSGGVAVLASRREGGWRLVAGAATVMLASIGTIGLWLNVREQGPTWFEQLFPDDFVQATTPVGGRPVAETCVAFILLALALGSLSLRRCPRAGQAFAIAGASVGLSAVVGYVLGVDRTSLGGSLVYVGMALHTGLGIALVGLAAILVRPDVGVVAQLLDGGVGGAVTRRVTLVVAAAPIVLVVIGVALSHTLPTDELSQSVFSVLQVAVLGGAILIPAGIISRTERQLREQLDAARRRDEHSADVDTVVEAVTREMVVVTPDVPGWEIGMRYQPATGHLAGDSVQVHHRLQPRPATLVAVIDIAGHDAYAAVVAYGLRAHIGALWEYGADLGPIVASANSKLVRRRTIATGVLLVFEEGSDEIQLVNAGHPPPIFLRAGQLSTWPLTGPLLGIDGTRHAVRTHHIQVGDTIVCYTDGLVEARSRAGQQLGDKTLHRLIHFYREQPAGQIADACMDAALEHAPTRLPDDALVLVARRC